jgi:uncharacterized damage-inducible protein DinB
MLTIADLINQLHTNSRIIKGRIDGLNHEDSLRQLSFPGNCLNWNLGHLMVYRHRILGMIDGVTDADPAEFAIYGAGSEPMTDGSQAIPFAELVERMDSAAAAIEAALAALPPERLGTVIDEAQGTTLGGRLLFYLIYHEAYHTGQMEILRELALASR